MEAKQAIPLHHMQEEDLCTHWQAQEDPRTTQSLPADCYRTRATGIY